MDRLLLTRDLAERGFSPDEIRRMLARGEIARVRRGAYLQLRNERQAAADPHDLRTPHLQLIVGTEAQLHPRAVLSHGSAAAVWGLPLFRDMVGQVHLTRDRRGGGVRRSTVFVHGSPLRAEDRVLVEGHVVTSLARTAVDLARTLSFDKAVAVADSAVALGADQLALAECLEQARRWYGCPAARRVISFADGRSESVGESFSRVRLHDLGLAPSTLQFEVFDENGRLVGVTDFAWPEHRTLGEFDGAVKYGALRRPGESPEDAVLREKRREDALRDQGWEIARWGWEHLRTPEIIAARVRRAFDRASRTTRVARTGSK